MLDKLKIIENYKKADSNFNCVKSSFIFNNYYKKIFVKDLIIEHSPINKSKVDWVTRVNILEMDMSPQSFQKFYDSIVNYKWNKPEPSLDDCKPHYFFPKN